MKVMSIFGTRPEMIKMWATLKKLDELNFDHVMVHTGQNFTPELRDFFFKDLKLRKPDYELDIDTSSYGKEVADVILRLYNLLSSLSRTPCRLPGDTFSGLSLCPRRLAELRSSTWRQVLRAGISRCPSSAIAS